MIIFYSKDSGNIIGTIDGRIHSNDQLNIWIGKKEETERLIVQWIPVKDYKNEKGDIVAQDFEPNTDQKEIFFNLDKKPIDVYKYRVDLNTKQLIKIK